MDEKTTDELLQILNSTTHTSKLLAYTDSLVPPASSMSFHAYMTEKLNGQEKSAADIISAAQIQRNYGYQILNGQKHPGRDKVIALCLALSLPLSETQRALTVAQEGVLYPKKRRDCVLIFSVNKHLSVSETNELLYDMGEDSLL